MDESRFPRPVGELAKVHADSLMAEAFLVETLSDRASRWFHELTPLSVDSFRALVDAFLTNFANSRDRKLDSSDLFLIKQSEREDQRAYVKRFSLVMSELPPVDPAIAKLAMLQETRNHNLRESLAKATPSSPFVQKVHKYVQQKDTLRSK